MKEYKQYVVGSLIIIATLCALLLHTSSEIKKSRLENDLLIQKLKGEK